MSDNVPNEFERFVNEVAADTGTLKAVLTALVAKLAINSGRSSAVIDEYEEIAKISLEPKAPSDGDQEKERLHQLTLSRTDDYFRDLRTVVAVFEQARSRTRGN